MGLSVLLREDPTQLIKHKVSVFCLQSYNYDLFSSIVFNYLLNETFLFRKKVIVKNLLSICLKFNVTHCIFSVRAFKVHVYRYILYNRFSHFSFFSVGRRLIVLLSTLWWQHFVTGRLNIYAVYLDGVCISLFSDLLQSVCQSSAACYVYNVEFPESMKKTQWSEFKLGERYL
jgi:hypothetical protein